MLIAMQRYLRLLPVAFTFAVIAAMLLHGPIAQLPHYHEFADRRTWLGLPNAYDVISNLGFFIVGTWGLIHLRSASPAEMPGWQGYRLFLAALLLTALGSAFYHFAPDNTRLIWDRLPIGLACAGLLAGVRAETHGGGRFDVLLLVAAAVGSVAWWHVTEKIGNGDLRPYLLLQLLPLALIPMWLWIYGAPKRDRMLFAIAIVLYVIAKTTELQDHSILSLTGSISGHTLKHLLATAAAATITYRLVSSSHRHPESACNIATTA